MKTSKNKIYIFAGVVILGLATYFGVKLIKKSRKVKQDLLDAELAATQQIVVTPVGVTPLVAPTIAPKLQSNPFLTKAELIAFQKWVYDVKKDKSLATNKTPNGQDGLWGTLSSAAWTKYGKEYLTSKGTGDVSTTPSNKDIDFIIKYSKGTGANLQTSNLTKKPINYIKNWVSAIRLRIQTGGNAGTTFSYDGKLFNSYNGDKISDIVFYNKEAKSKETSYGFLKPDKYSGSVKYLSNISLGKVKDMIWNNDQQILFLYVPEGATNYKWTTNNQITIN